MKKMIIFEPAMCCSTGVCGPGVDRQLLRVSSIINNLKNNGILVERYNLSGNPQMFVDNKTINKMLNESGIEVLPVTMVDDIVVKIKKYPTDEEFASLLDVQVSLLKSVIKKPSIKKTSKGCGCDGGCC
ncbi:arsenite efflux transporter metallochaperone ArsD [Clostridium estertheticum]|uniref:arsenite efflux transporter metallochaperone ArsD n=1 Tax=Clostridium estertheticum TaxID=238834 RepID=UPI00124F7488|nr:arsenite efflux transporter metallochaperone ArsD [Clostridium estertheticum]MBU3076112.1 arsenite efflux transporter metallochaperone ArsD [Clostridium estertheticum]MBU3165911.1 arsenite efflux transporter metallochaperone ArsD [Clostridium estertheticum]MBZ9616035.1 arsenite efflux transporter metallochaperone ArsD [Clostridium estertheticum subsp. laramiense]WAG75898.1 arsenite efflux transporter metallochaperone ArsD [Clostridium estertheticum]